MNKLEQQAHRVIDTVGHILAPVYLVGGSVRDLLRGVEPEDYDFASPLSPDEMEAAVRSAGKHPFLTGKRFGTIGFRLDGRMVEVTTFRLETYPPGSRKPQVEFVRDISHDLSRRDFTVNAMAMRRDGRLIDPFGGRRDVAAGIIRTVGKPYERFNEDPLRMLRAARFAAQLGFSIEAETQSHTAKKAHKILEVSRERWTQELDKLLLGTHPEYGLSFLARTRLLHFMLPELSIQAGFDQDSPYHTLDLWEHTLKTVRLTPADTTLRWAALLHDIGKSYTRTLNSRGYSNYVYHEQVGAELVKKIGPYLRWPTVRTEAVSQLVLTHLRPESPLRDADTAATKD